MILTYATSLFLPLRATMSPTFTFLRPALCLSFAALVMEVLFPLRMASSAVSIGTTIGDSSSFSVVLSYLIHSFWPSADVGFSPYFFINASYSALRAASDGCTSPTYSYSTVKPSPVPAFAPVPLLFNSFSAVSLVFILL